MAREKGLYRRKDSPYWWIDTVLPNGRRVCESTRLRELAAAEEYLVRLKAQAYRAQRSGLCVDHDWQEAVVRYLKENTDKRTIDDDAAHLRRLDPYLRDLTISRINMDALWPFIHQRREVDGVANATVNRALEVVRRILHLAFEEWNWLERIPKIRMLRELKKRIRFLSRDEADQLVAALADHLKPVVQFALTTGCRMGEIMSLEWRRVDFNRRVAWLEPGTTKNGEGRGIPLHRDALIALRAVVGDHEQFCFTFAGNPMKKVGSGWKRALARAEITNFRFHDLKHTWASWHVMNGTSLQELMELGGWKSYEMVLRYAHLAPEHLAGAAVRIEEPLALVENSTIALRST